jgi:hypothetical protein
MALETDFRTKPQLSQYLPKIQGIGTLCGQSEDSAIAGRFVASKDPLRQIAQRLNDALAVLPGPLLPDSTIDSNQPTSVSNQDRAVSSAANGSRPVVNQNVSNTKSDVSVGMSIVQVLASSWGAPSINALQPPLMERPRYGSIRATGPFTSLTVNLQGSSSNDPDGSPAVKA